MHSLANEDRSEERSEEVGGRCQEGDEIVNFLWVAVRTVVVVEDGPEAEAVSTGVTKVDGPEDGPGAVTTDSGPEEKPVKGVSKLQRNYLSVAGPASQLQEDLSYPSSFISRQSNLPQAVRYWVDPFLALSFTLNP